MATADGFAIDIPVLDVAVCIATAGALAATAANARTSDRPAGAATPLRCAAPAAGTLSCPRHFFSSHSTQSTRPVDTGNPQASHWCSVLNTGGTRLRSASSAWAASAAGFNATDQNNGFFAGAASAAVAAGSG